MGRAEAPPEVKAIVVSGRPKGAQEIANVLAARYGRFDASNPAENRAAILNALNWVADTNQGVAYNHARAAVIDLTTQSPNTTIAGRSGVCREIHTATAAILASLMNATRGANGEMVAGAPTGREQDVQAASFATATEYHDFMVYKDPVTKKWSSLEYSKRYELGSDSAASAMQETVGDVPALIVSPGSDAANFGIVAQGRTVDRKLVPIDTIGVAVQFTVKTSELSIGAKSVFPDGKFRGFGSR